MPTLDIFNDDAFSLSSLTARVNTEIGYVPHQIGSSGLFEEDGVNTLSVMVEERGGNLSLIEPSPRGGPGETTGSDKDKLRSFVIPHIQRDDAVMADEVQGRRRFGTESDVETVQNVVDRKAARHFRAIDMTVEHFRVGALKGKVLTKSGATLYNLFTEFEIAEPAAFDFALTTAGTKLRSKCFDLVRSIEDELDESYDHIHAFVGDDFWKSFIEHASVKETYLNTQQANELRGSLVTDKFEFGGIIWERYRTGKKGTAANAGAGFIAADEARFAPVGVPELFITRFGPADYEETVNTDGLPRYANQYAMPNGKGRNMEFQSNPLCLCTRPGVLRKGIIAA